MLKKDEPKYEQEEKPLSDKNPLSAVVGDDSLIVESPASPVAEDCSAEIAQPDFTPPVIPAVSVVTITRRDPRRAGYRSAPSPSVDPSPSLAPSPAPVPAPVIDPTKILTTLPSYKEIVEEMKAAEPSQPPVPPPLVLKSILTKPMATSAARFYSSSSLTARLASYP